MSANVSLANSEYWNQLCGSRAAKKLGISVGDPKDVEKFDRWFFYFYPYLHDQRFIPWKSLSEARVLEVGLGYGSTTRRLAKHCSHLVCVDIAPGAVRFAQATTEDTSPIRASALELPLCSNSMDFVISLGCLHHTGNMQVALQECLRVTKPGGQLIVMLYNRYSYKRWITAPISTWRSRRAEWRGVGGSAGASAPRRVSWFWDRSPAGAAPPHTEFATRDQLRGILSSATEVRIESINMDNLTDLLPQRLQSVTLDSLRVRLLNSWLSRRVGLDLYVSVIK